MLDFPVQLGRRPAQVAPAETPGLRSLLTVAVAFVVIAGLYLGRSVLIPLTPVSYTHLAARPGAAGDRSHGSRCDAVRGGAGYRTLDVDGGRSALSLIHI